MDGIEFEYYLEALFSKLKYKPSVTKASHDYGADEAWIVTNSFFTKSAVELGNACSIIMKDRNTLSKWIISINPDFSNNEKCPRCNHELVVRTGKNGQFLGCSNYPNCKYTKNI